MRAQRPEHRQALHEKLFSNKFSASQFRLEVEASKSPDLDLDGKDIENLGDGPKDPKTRSGGRAKGSNSGVPKPDFYSVSRTQLLDALPPDVKKLQRLRVDNWSDLTDLTESISGILTAHSNRISNGYTVIIVPPMNQMKGAA